MCHCGYNIYIAYIDIDNNIILLIILIDTNIAKAIYKR